MLDWVLGVVTVQTSCMDRGQSGFPPLMSHEPMFQISAQSVEEIQSYWSANVGYRIWLLMVVRESDLEIFLMF